MFCGIFWDLLTVNFRKLSSVQMLRVGRRKCLLCKLVFLQFSSQTVGCRQYMEPRLLTNAVHPTTPSTTNTPKLYTAEKLRHFIFPTKVGKRSKSYKKLANNVWPIPMEEFMVLGFLTVTLHCRALYTRSFNLSRRTYMRKWLSE